MKRKRGEHTRKLSMEQSNGNFPDRMQLTIFAEKIVTDATKKGIKRIHIISGKVNNLSKAIEIDKIIVKVPSREQSIFLRNYINRASSDENPFLIIITHSTGSNGGDGTGSRHGLYTTERIVGSSAGGNGAGKRNGKNPPVVRMASRIAGGDGTGKRNGKNLIGHIAGSSAGGDGTGGRHGINLTEHIAGISAGGDGTGGRREILIQGSKGGDGTGIRRGIMTRGSKGGDGTGIRRGIMTRGHKGGDGTGGRRGIMTRRHKGGDGTGGRRGKTPPRTKF